MPTARARALALLGLLAATCAACAFAPDGATPFLPGAFEQGLYLEAEQCSGLQGNFALITWYEVPGEWFPGPQGQHDAGRWEWPHTIYISAAYRHHSLVVKHEILHDLIGRPGHPDPPFANPCKATWASWAPEGGS